MEVTPAAQDEKAIDTVARGSPEKAVTVQRKATQEDDAVLTTPLQGHYVKAMAEKAYGEEASFGLFIPILKQRTPYQRLCGHPHNDVTVAVVTTG